MRGLSGVVVLLAVVSGVAEGQQSVGAPPRVIAPTARELAEAREATGMKCLSIQGFSAQTLNSGAAPTMRPARRTTRGGLGLGALDASEGMSRPPMTPQMHILRDDIDQRGTRSFSGAMMARWHQVDGCSPVAPKVGSDRRPAEPSRPR